MHMILEPLVRYSLAAFLLVSLVPTASMASFMPELQDLDIPGITPEITQTYLSVLEHTKEGNSEQAIVAAKEVVEQFISVHGKDSEFLAAPVVRLGLVQLDNGDIDGALVSFDRSIRLIEPNAGTFARGLVAPLYGSALSHIQLENYDQATEALRRAQSITHRHEGVYNTDQLKIIEELIRIDRKRGKQLEIERQERFNLKIHEKAYGKEDPRIIPALLQLGEHMAERGAKLRALESHSTASQANEALRRFKLFRQSTDYYRRAIDIVEKNYGESSLEIIKPLQGMAEEKLLIGFGKKTAVESLTRVVEVVKSNPGSDVGDVVRAIVDLADLYTRWHDRRAKQAYREAWNAIPDGDQYQQLRDELFGAPVRLAPTALDAWLRRKPWLVEGEIYTELKYTVLADGRARRIEIVGGNAPRRAASLLRRKLYHARFRPKVVDGEVVATEGLVLKRNYQLYD